jgi:long-chain-fatty-acid--[acyl-carrier-protein] ligase
MQPEDLPVGGDRLAIVQATSGTTGERRLVGITWSMLRNQIDELSRMLEIAPENDSHLASWLPLYHDMGLIAFWVLPALRQVDCTLLSTPLFQKNARAWADVLSDGAVTMTAMPNAGFATTAKLLQNVNGDYLASLRDIFCSAELINYNAIQRFVDCAASRGMDEGAVGFAYGMAEATLAVSVKRHALLDNPWFTPQGAQPGLRFARCGMPLGDTRVELAPPPEPLALGASPLVIAGTSVADHYIGEPSTDGWHRTGDCGVLDRGEIVPMWRTSEALKINGVTIPPVEIEAAISGMAGVAPGGVAALVAPSARGEAPALVVEVAGGGAPQPSEASIRAAVHEATSVSLAYVRLVPRGSIPRTSSGKLRRLACRALYFGETN